LVEHKRERRKFLLDSIQPVWGRAFNTCGYHRPVKVLTGGLLICERASTSEALFFVPA